MFFPIPNLLSLCIIKKIIIIIIASSKYREEWAVPRTNKNYALRFAFFSPYEYFWCLVQEKRAMDLIPFIKRTLSRTQSSWYKRIMDLLK